MGSDRRSKMTFFQLCMASYSKYSADGPMLLALWFLDKFFNVFKGKGLEKYHEKSIWKRSYNRMKRYTEVREKMLSALDKVDKAGDAAQIANNLIQQTGVIEAAGNEDLIRGALKDMANADDKVKDLMGWSSDAIQNMANNAKASVKTNCITGCGAMCANIGFEWCFGWAITFVALGPIFAMAFIFGGELIIAATGFDIFPFHYRTGQPLFLKYENKKLKGVDFKKLVRCRLTQGRGQGCCYWFKWNHVACLVRSFVGLFAVLLLPLLEEALPCFKPCWIKLSKLVHGPSMLGILAPEVLPPGFWHFELIRLAKGFKNEVKDKLKEEAWKAAVEGGGSPAEAAEMML